MKWLKTILLMGAALAAWGCAPSIAVNHDYNPRVSFAAFRTYRWLAQPAPEAGGMQASLLDARIKLAVDERFRAKGFEQAHAPDFFIAYHVGARDRIDVNRWGYAHGRVSVKEYREGTLVLDIIDARSMQLVWRGYAQGTLDPGASTHEREQRLKQAVDKMLASFPPA